MTLFTDIALSFFFFYLTRYLADYAMHRSPFARNRNRSVLPAFPHQNSEPKTSSKSSGSSLDSHDESGRGHGNQEFYPSMEDVLEVRDLIRRMGPTAHNTVPDEIVDIILDEAEYWPSVVTSLNTTPFVIGADGDKECLRTPPLCFGFKEGTEGKIDVCPSFGQSKSIRTEKVIRKTRSPKKRTLHRFFYIGAFIHVGR